MAHTPQSARNQAASLRTRARELRRIAGLALKEGAATRKGADDTSQHNMAAKTTSASARMLASKVVGIVMILVALGGITLAAQNKYALRVPNGLAFSEFRGYESWQVVSISQDGDLIAAILGNPVMIRAYQSGIPGNGKPFPDGAKLAKIHWNPKKMETFPAATVPGTQHDMDFMVKDSKRFADSGGWGYAVFEYDSASDTFTPGTLASKPPQANDAKCGYACHTRVKARDYVFTEYGHR